MPRSLSEVSASQARMSSSKVSRVRESVSGDLYSSVTAFVFRETMEETSWPRRKETAEVDSVARCQAR